MSDKLTYLDKVNNRELTDIYKHLQFLDEEKEVKYWRKEVKKELEKRGMKCNI